MYLRDAVTVAPRYARAINLERDATTDAAVNGYVVTQTGQMFLRRLAGAFGDAGRHRSHGREHRALCGIAHARVGGVGGPGQRR